jgi:hypothetical protein
MLKKSIKKIIVTISMIGAMANGISVHSATLQDSLSSMEYMKLPQKAIEYFEDSDLNIAILEQGQEIEFLNPTKDNTKDLKGLYNKVDNIITLEEGQREGRTLYHELGHAFYNDNGEDRIIDSLSYRIVYLLEKGKMTNEHYSESLDEFYAEVFSMYCYDKEELEEDFPLSYKLLDKYFNEK